MPSNFGQMGNEPGRWCVDGGAVSLCIVCKVWLRFEAMYTVVQCPVRQRKVDTAACNAAVPHVHYPAFRPMPMCVTFNKYTGLLGGFQACYVWRIM